MIMKNGSFFKHALQFTISLSLFFISSHNTKAYNLNKMVFGDMDSLFVDLGLSVKWAKCNLGARTPFESGQYYAWGDSLSFPTKHIYNEESYIWYSGRDTIVHDFINIPLMIKYGSKNDPYNTLTETKTTLDKTDDPATILLGPPWRTPSSDELQELIECCIWTYCTIKGVSGYKVMSRDSNNYIFLPTSGFVVDSEIKGKHIGYYWSNTLSDASMGANMLFISHSIYGEDKICVQGELRWLGLNIRPVYDDE